MVKDRRCIPGCIWSDSQLLFSDMVRKNHNLDQMGTEDKENSEVEMWRQAAGPRWFD